jgi:hypothetical protein
MYVGIRSDALVEQSEPCCRAASTRYGKGTVHAHAGQGTSVLQQVIEASDVLPVGLGCRGGTTVDG